MSEYKVHVEVDGVVYRGRHSVHQRGDRVYVDGKLVGVECDNDGNPLASTLELAAPVPVTRRTARLRRAWRRVLSILRRKATC